MKEDDVSRSDQKIVEMEEDPVQPSEPLEVAAVFSLIHSLITVYTL